MNPVIIDLKVGNIHSLKSAINYLGINIKVSDNVSDINRASHIILPGVGAFDSMAKEVNEKNLQDVISENILIKKKPFLGICVGMQYLFASSQEGNEKGLNIIKRQIKKLEVKDSIDFKIPHVGFANVFNFKDDGLFRSIKNPFFYFTHSYACEEFQESTANIALCKHSKNFLAGFQKDNICGVQFHPEKSQSFGMKILTNFFNNI